MNRTSHASDAVNELSRVRDAIVSAQREADDAESELASRFGPEAAAQAALAGKALSSVDRAALENRVRDACTAIDGLVRLREKLRSELAREQEAELASRRDELLARRGALAAHEKDLQVKRDAEIQQIRQIDAELNRIQIIARERMRSRAPRIAAVQA